jgi:hypothetical protein
LTCTAHTVGIALKLVDFTFARTNTELSIWTLDVLALVALILVGFIRTALTRSVFQVGTFNLVAVGASVLGGSVGISLAFNQGGGGDSGDGG